jgi:C1A family cysteine protease
MKKHRLNWRPDLPDFRDHFYSISYLPGAPSKVDLRAQCPPIVNQGQIGSCTANALSGAIGFLEIKELQAKSGADIFTPGKFNPVSRMFIYYNERALEGTVDQDAGARIRDGVKTLNKQGVCKESTWKYQANLLTKKPTPAAYREASNHCITEYLRIGSLAQLKACLAEGFPVAFGFTVYESFESPNVAKSGVMPMPLASEKVLGGHAVLAVGYDDEAKALIVRNSWGTDWGMAGYFVMPYAYVENLHLAQDFWTLRK